MGKQLGLGNIYIYIYISISKFAQGLAVNLSPQARFWGIGITRHFGGLFRTGKLCLKSRPESPTGAPKSTKIRPRTFFFNVQRLWETRRRKVTQKSPSRAVPEANIWCSVYTERHFSVFLLDPRKPAKDSSRASRWDPKCTRVSQISGKIRSRQKSKKKLGNSTPEDRQFQENDVKMAFKIQVKFNSGAKVVPKDPKTRKRRPK